MNKQSAIVAFDEELEDLEELSPSIRAQLAHWEARHHQDTERPPRRQRRQRVRRQIEDWMDARRMRDDLDYIR